MANAVQTCGHVPQVECPEQTNRLLLEFFGRVERAEAATARSGSQATMRTARADTRAA